MEDNMARLMRKGEILFMASSPSAPRLSASHCPHCGGECEPQLITLTLRRSQYGFAVVRNVPADVCMNCGESQFAVTTTCQMLSALHSNRTPDDVALIPIYD